MSDRDENLRDYLVLLRRFGLSKGELARLHWSESPDPPDVPAERIVAHEIDDEERTIDALYPRLHRILVESSIGVDLSPTAAASQYETALQGAFDPYDVRIEIEPVADPDLDSVHEGDPIDVLLTDRRGNSRSTTDAYPGPDELPELVGVLERELLDDVDVTFVRLEPEDEAVRMLLLSTPRLDALRETYGDRVPFGDRPLLAERQPTDFVSTSSPETDAGDEGGPESEIEDDDAEMNWLSDDDVDLADVGFEPATAASNQAESTGDESDHVDEVAIDRAFAEIESAASEMDWGESTLEGDAHPASSQETSESSPEPAFSEEVLDDVSDPSTVDVPITAESDGASGDGDSAEASMPSIQPSANPRPAVAPVRTTPAEDPTPATNEMSTAPGGDPTPAIERRAGRPADEPATAPASAVDRIVTTPETETETAVTAIDVRPGTEVAPAVIPRSDPSPAVAPTRSPRPAVSRIETRPDGSATSATSRIAVTPDSDPDPAIHERETDLAVAPSVDPLPAIHRASPISAVEPGPETEPESKSGPASATTAGAPADGEPSPADSPDSNAEPAITPGESPSSAVHRIEVTPGDDPTEAVLWAPFVYSPRSPPSTPETDESDESTTGDESKGVVERLTGWIGNRL
ncbi:MAG: hypothetical protein ACOCSN_04415 [Halanaeroarchaeum sp.]